MSELWNHDAGLFELAKRELFTALVGDVVVGDVLVGDLDGVCIVPRSREREVFTAAIEKARAERVVFDQLRQGMEAEETFARYGVM
jgi:regulator of RNase E activity RraA